MTKKIFDENGFALQDCRVKVYNYDRENHEFISATMEHTVKGSGIPANATLVVPFDDQEGFTQVFNGEAWEYVEDHRYADVYNIHTKQKEDIRYIGELKEEHTLLTPPSQDHDFVKGKWVITKEKKAELKEREEAQAQADLNNQINDLKLRLRVHMMMGEEEEAKALVLEIRAIEAEMALLQ